MDVADVLKEFLTIQQSRNHENNWRALVGTARTTLSAWAEAGSAVKRAAEAVHDAAAAVGNRAARS